MIAVILLHISSTLSPLVELPKVELQVAKKLVPVVLVNIIGLVFNTLCLRDVEASFFQVSQYLKSDEGLLTLKKQCRLLAVLCSRSQ